MIDLFDLERALKPAPKICRGRWYWPFHSWSCEEDSGWLFFLCKRCRVLVARPR